MRRVIIGRAVSDKNQIARVVTGIFHIPTTSLKAIVARQVTSMAGEARKLDRRVSPGESDARAHDSENGKKQNINFLRGWPAASLLPAEALRAASQTALSDSDIWVPGLEYGPDPGYQPLREALAEWLGRFYGDVASPPHEPSRTSETVGGSGPKVRDIKAEAERITITGGASQSLACLLQSFTDPARTLAIWVVAPCYFLACPILVDAGFAGRLRAVPEDEEGVDVKVLEREMCAVEEQHQQQQGEEERRYKDPGPNRKIYRHIVYCVPAFSNPSGLTTTLARRTELVDLARRHDALVICDDVYDMLQWRCISPSPSPSPLPQHPHKALLPRIADIDLALGRSPHDPPGKHFGHAVSNGSFSKLVAPGTRTGWTYSTADFARGNAATGSTRSGGAASQMAGAVVCQLLLPLSRSQDGGDEGKGGGDEYGEWYCELDKHIREILVPTYARRHAVLMRAVRDILVPLGLSVREDSLQDQSWDQSGIYGGYFVWLRLPRGATIPPSTLPSSTTTTTTSSEPPAWPTAQAIATRCRVDEDLTIGNGELFAVHGDEGAARFDDAIRLCFSWVDEERDLVDGVERLGRVIRRMLVEGPARWEGEGEGDVEGVK